MPAQRVVEKRWLSNHLAAAADAHPPQTEPEGPADVSVAQEEDRVSMRRVARALLKESRQSEPTDLAAREQFVQVLGVAFLTVRGEDNPVPLRRIRRPGASP